MQISDKVQGFNIIDGHVILIHLGCNIVPIQKQLMSIASLIKEISGKSILLFIYYYFLFVPTLVLLGFSPLVTFFGAIINGYY
jgi:hypothetical protein